ncbi:helix-turn-helix domain-containing protein [Allorhizobium sp. BGMRC 0089]|uniref:helix-turn-helix domain-containing protein n=1 Tax=Allorhizobium sonneratiae TaxID=2934936 RepID=UPI00203367B9|nr:helix-turn-helix transcriptional regulator [Allorhizobium sonneratiae]MCM2294354.1 helix-turn-helix domain-containing protein [Allorhizobium sonneratiae]
MQQPDRKTMLNKTKAPNLIDMLVGTRIRTARIRTGLSQEKLAKACAITFQQIQKYEKGTSRLSVSRMSQIAAKTGYPVSWFFEDIDQPDTPPKDETTLFLQSSEAHKLAKAWLRLKNQSSRHAVYTVIDALATNGGDEI